MTKLKKSAVVIPALARIAVTAAASVSGTVAWFTANRSVTVNGSNFNAVAQDGDLSISLITNRNVGVIADAEETANPKPTGSVKMADKTSLTDASYNPENNRLYTKVLSENTDGSVAVNSYEELGEAMVANSTNSPVENPNWHYNNTKDSTAVYYGVSWTWTFTYNFKSDANDMALFFNFKESQIGITNKKNNEKNVNRNGAESEAALGVGKGFRLAMLDEAKANNVNITIVWAPTGAGRTHVISKTGTGTFDTDIFREIPTSTADKKIATDLDEHYSTENDYCFLGRLTSTNPSINVKCTAWFEGTDSNVVNEALDQVVSTTQKYYVRKLAKN